MTFLDQFIVPFEGHNYTIASLQDLFSVHNMMSEQFMINEQFETLSRVKRRYQIYEKQEPEKKPKGACPPTGGISGTCPMSTVCLHFLKNLQLFVYNLEPLIV